jgi:hypothetical protein
MIETMVRFEDVERWVQLEEPVMSYEVLVKWCARYPQYSEELSRLFLDEAVHLLHAGELQHLLVLTDEERYSPFWDYPDADMYAMEVLREQGRPVPPPLR